jgi:uroporphyrinogen decarboxylase
MMSSRENIANLFARKPAERVGVMDNIWAQTLDKWITQGYPSRRVRQTGKVKFRENGQEVEREAETERDQALPPHEHFGFDMAGAGGWFDMMPLKGFSEVVEETEEWRITRNGAGAALKYWKRRAGTPEHIDFRMTSREVWERDYRPHLVAVDRTRVNVENARKALAKVREQGYWTFFGHLFIWENMRRSLGDVCMYESLVLDPGWIHDYNRVHTDFYKAHYKILFEEAGVPDGVWMYEDLGYNKGLFCSPKVLAELIFPYFKEVVDFFHSYGLPVVLHSCGSATEAMPLIVEAGFDGLHPMEVAAGNDTFRYAEQYGDRLVFIGGFDKRILESHDHERIRKEVTAFVRGMKERGARYVFASDHSISTNTDYQDFRCALEAYRENMMY